jgi:DNA-binding GntR family transcriptional regulator
MNIDFKWPVPLYKQITEALREEIPSGKFPVRSQVASHQELAKAVWCEPYYSEERSGGPHQRGILFGRAGKGTFVMKRPSQAHEHTTSDQDGQT